MNKILLVYDDYADLMSIEGTLKKVGFDVIGLSNEYSVADQVIGFNPDLVIGSGRGSKVSSLGVGKRLKEMSRWNGKSLLIFPANFKPSPQDLIRIRVDMILEAPVPPVRLVQVIGKMLGHDEAVLLERLNKVMHVESPQKSKTGGVTGGSNPENEAIFVKGSVDTMGQEGNDNSLSSERIQEDSQQFDITPEEETRKVSFKFGDRVSGALIDAAEEEPSEEAFPDVDLKALEQEILGGGAPEIERIEVQSESTEDQEAAAIQKRAKEELRKVEKNLKDRIAKYSGMVADVTVPPKSTVTRVEARRRQRDLESQWDEANISEIDKLRREFAKALFKK